MKNSNSTVDSILSADADKLMRNDRLMPTSLAQFINKRHRDLIPVDECYDRFEDAVGACRHHREAFGFIPNEWADFMTEVKLNIKFRENPTLEPFMDELIEVQGKRLAIMIRIAALSSDYDQEELLELTVTELEEIQDELLPLEKRMEKGSFGRGFNKKAA